MSKPQPRLPPTNKPKQDIPFVFLSYKALRQQLGEIDALAAAIVVSTRGLTAEAEASGDTRAHLIERAAVHHVSTRHVDFAQLESRTVQLLLVGVFQQVEIFLDALRKEQALFGRLISAKNDGEAPMMHALRTLPGGSLANRQRVGGERFDLLDYYRLVRNAFAHDGDEQRLSRVFEAVSVYRSLVSEEFGLTAPNPVGELTHDDYLLATRLAKYLATDICRIAGPTGAVEIIAMIGGEKVVGDPVGMIRRRRNNEDRTRKAVSRWLFNRFHYDVAEHPGVLDSIMEWSATLPTRREVRRVRRSEMGGF